VADKKLDPLPTTTQRLKFIESAFTSLPHRPAFFLLSSRNAILGTVTAIHYISRFLSSILRPFPPPELPREHPCIVLVVLSLANQAIGVRVKVLKSGELRCHFGMLGQVVVLVHVELRPADLVVVVGVGGSELAVELIKRHLVDVLGKLGILLLQRHHVLVVLQIQLLLLLFELLGHLGHGTLGMNLASEEPRTGAEGEGLAHPRPAAAPGLLGSLAVGVVGIKIVLAVTIIGIILIVLASTLLVVILLTSCELTYQKKAECASHNDIHDCDLWS
jgi:hypothetical protein